jgi:manganese transport protein
VKAVLQIALGILAAIGGFVDIGDLVFNVQAGGLFGYQLIWAVLVGLIGIMVFAEMSGRVAAVSDRAAFDLIRGRLGFAAGLVVLVAAQLVSLLTLAAETGGVAIVLRLYTGLPYRLLIPIAVLILLLILWLVPFDWIERIFGYIGLLLIIFGVAAVILHPNWGAAAAGLIPTMNFAKPLVYLYFVVGLIGTTMSPYEVYFYSSGGVEDHWKEKDLPLNKVTVFLGFGLGALLSLFLIVTSAEYFNPRGIQPEFLGTTPLPVMATLGKVGLLIAMAGMLFCVGGAAIETCLASAYNFGQFFGWQWGKYHKPSQAGRFTLTWIIFLLLAMLIIITGVDAVKLTEVAVIFAAVALPLTYFPVLLVANDRHIMGKHANGPLANGLGLIYLVILTVVALGAIPLLIITNGGQG